MRRTASLLIRVVLLVGVLSLGVVDASQAQAPRDREQGTVALESWPRSLPTLLDEMGQKAPYLLPRIDSLALDYRYAVTDTTSRWSFVLNWRPAERVLYEGEVLPRREAPQDIRMTNVEFRASVRVNGEKRAEMIIGIDSMALRPTPDRFAFNVTVPHGRVFLDTSPGEARRILSEGATLDRLIVERMGFSAPEARRGGRSDPEPDARRRREEPSRKPSIYRSRTRILIGWRVAPRPYYVDDEDEDGDRETRRPRGNTIGRTPTADEDRSRDAERNDEAEGRSDGRNREGTDKTGEDDTDQSRDEDDDEDEDDTDLDTPALAAAAAVGVVAFAGGTFGLYGQGDTPIGLASGYTHPKGGIQLQAAVNRAVLEDEPDQQLSIKALGFYDVFESRLQPAVGLGVRIDPDQGRDWESAVSAGLVGNFGRFVLYGGVDVVQGTPEIGVAYNFRYGRNERE